MIHGVRSGRRPSALRAASALAIAALLSCTGASRGGCSTSCDLDTSSSSTPTPTPTTQRAELGDFRLEIDDYNWEVGGSKITRISSDGTVEYVFYRGEREPASAELKAKYPGTEYVNVPRWYVARFTLDAQELSGLVRLLEEGDLFSLDSRYVDEGVEDGAHTRFELTAGDRSKAIECSNEYPAPLRDLLDHVDRTLIPAHAETLSQAEKLDDAKAKELGAVR